MAMSPPLLMCILTGLLAGSLAWCDAKCTRDPIIFAFGDSNSDTGNSLGTVGDDRKLLGDGRAFFHKHTGRFCDGRLILDFLCESLNRTYLQAFLKPLGADLRHGANFAYAGSFASGDGGYDSCFNLPQQVDLFLSFKHQVETSKGHKVIDDEGFKRALYMIDIGQNDLSTYFWDTFRVENVYPKLPQILGNITTSIERLYEAGARNFWVHGTGPMGCLTFIVTNKMAKKEDLDAIHCVKSANELSKDFNRRLLSSCQELQSKLSGSTIVYTDIYPIKYDIKLNYKQYGFDDAFRQCTDLPIPDCPIGTRYVQWDDVHNSEGANSIIASKILSQNFSTPKLPIDFFCRD